MLIQSVPYVSAHISPISFRVTPKIGFRCIQSFFLVPREATHNRYGSMVCNGHRLEGHRLQPQPCCVVLSVNWDYTLWSHTARGSSGNMGYAETYGADCIHSIQSCNIMCIFPLFTGTWLLFVSLRLIKHKER